MSMNVMKTSIGRVHFFQEKILRTCANLKFDCMSFDFVKNLVQIHLLKGRQIDFIS